MIQRKRTRKIEYILVLVFGVIGWYRGYRYYGWLILVAMLLVWIGTNLLIEGLSKTLTSNSDIDKIVEEQKHWKKSDL